MRGENRIKNKEWSLGFDDINDAIKLDPSIPDLYLHRGNAWKERGELKEAMADFDQAISANPLSALSYLNRGICWCEVGKFEKAITDLETSLRLDGSDFQTWNQIAWLRATCPEDRFRNGQQAIEYATKACELTGYGNWWIVDTLGAAYAEASDFPNAVKWQQRSKDLCTDPKSREATAAQERLDGYKTFKRPYREPVKKRLAAQQK